MRVGSPECPARSAGETSQRLDSRGRRNGVQNAPTPARAMDARGVEARRQPRLRAAADLVEKKSSRGARRTSGEHEKAVRRVEFGRSGGLIEVSSLVQMPFPGVFKVEGELRTRRFVTRVS